MALLRRRFIITKPKYGRIIMSNEENIEKNDEKKNNKQKKKQLELKSVKGEKIIGLCNWP